MTDTPLWDRQSSLRTPEGERVFQTNQKPANLRKEFHITLPSIDLPRPKTVTLKNPRVIFHPSLQQQHRLARGIFKPKDNRRLLHKACHICGREFDHEKYCQEGLLLNKISNKMDKGGRKYETASTSISTSSAGSDGIKTITVGEESIRSSERKEQADGLCEQCGLYFNKRFITNHRKLCLHQRRQKESTSASDVIPKSESRSRVIARIVTIGPGQCETVYVHSNVEENQPGSESPSHCTVKNKGIDNKNKTYGKSSFKQCENCGMSVTFDRLAVHMRSCKSPSQQVKTGKVDFPSKSHTPLRVEGGKKLKAETPQKATVTCEICGREYGSQSIRIHEPQCRKKFNLEKKKLKELNRPPVNRRPPTVICYICGREYGSQSIAIHEPQCLKKWIIENDKLPPRERHPLPVKRQNSGVAQVISSQDGKNFPGSSGAYNNVEEVFDQSYSNFQQNLIPCKTCGRTFVLDRHRVHEPNCKARPLKKKE